LKKDIYPIYLDDGLFVIEETSDKILSLNNKLYDIIEFNNYGYYFKDFNRFIRIDEGEVLNFTINDIMDASYFDVDRYKIKFKRKLGKNLPDLYPEYAI